MNDKKTESTKVNTTANQKYMLATELLKRNELKEALEEINQALSIEKNSALYLETKGKILTMLGSLEEAKQTLEKTLEINPNQYLPYVILGQILYAQGNKKTAKKHFILATKTGSPYCDADVSLAKILIDEGQIDLAIEKLNEIKKENPEDQTLLLTLGQAYLELGEYYLAEDLYQTMIKTTPENDLARLYLGISKLYTGDLRQAQELIEKYNYYYPNKREGLAGLGLLQFELTQYDEAKEYLKHAIGKGNAPMFWKSTYVEALVNLGKLKPAIKFYKKLKKKFDNKASICRLGELYEVLNKLDKAKRNYKKIRPKDHNYFSAREGLVRCFITEEKYQEAEEACRQVLKSYPNDQQFVYKLVTSLLQQNKQEEAIATVDQIDSSRINPLHQQQFKQLKGLIFDNQEKYKKAMTVFDDCNNDGLQSNGLLTEADLKKIKGFNNSSKQKTDEPVFILGAKSTLIEQFTGWLKAHKMDVITDRLKARTREDVFNKPTNISNLSDEESDLIKFRRKNYFKKAQRKTKGENIIEGLNFTPLTCAIIKRYFPSSHVIILTRDTPDIWLHQKIFKTEQVDSFFWNEAINQVISMGINLVVINADDWLDGQADVMQTISTLFDKKIPSFQPNKQKYWNRHSFNKGHWKQYKEFLGQ